MQNNYVTKDIKKLRMHLNIPKNLNRESVSYIPLKLSLKQW